MGEWCRYSGDLCYPRLHMDDCKKLRVLTGGDFDVEGLAFINQECAVIGDELMPAIIMVNPKTGVILSPFSFETISVF